MLQTNNYVLATDQTMVCLIATELLICVILICSSYGASCVECQRLHAVWEGVGATLRGRINVARVDANLAGQNTAKRFKVTKLPTFLL